MSSWTMQDDDEEQRHMVLLIVGFLLILVAAAVLYVGNTRSQWPAASAQVLSVEVRCVMDPHGMFTRSSRRAPPVYIDCDDVDQFLADNTHRRWSVYRLHSGDVRVVRDGIATTVNLGLGRVGNPPRVGDRFDVVQNPDNPRDVAFPDASVGEAIVGALLGGLGTFVIAAAFFL